MSIVRVEEELQPLKYLVITQQKDPDSVITTNVVISDNRLNKINLLSIEKGPQGDTGLQGPQGVPGKDGIIFNVLPINSGGTNNTFFSSGNIIYFDGNKLSSSNYSIDDILNSAGSNAAITGIIGGSGLQRTINNNTVTLNTNIGDGLYINNDNQIAINDTVVRKVELSIGNIQGTVPIAKGGTNNQSFFGNRLLYYDGSKISSFPLETGRILLSGTTIDVIAGSGLRGGGRIGIPSGSVVLNIGGSSDIIVESQSISLSATGTAGTYSKVTTDPKGRVISGSNLSRSDIINILGYTPWHAGNDGDGSGLDADLLDGNNSNYFLNLSNQTGTLTLDKLPNQNSQGAFTKVLVNDKGIVINGLDSTYEDIIKALGYRPVSSSGDYIGGDLVINGNVTISDNLPVIATNTASILPSEPRGFSFLYGGYTPRTGILAYYPAEQELRLVTNITAITSNINGGDANNNFGNDIDGGDQNSVYLINNPTGTANIVLLRNIADNLYVSRLGDQSVSGIKNFKDGINIDGFIAIRSKFGQSSPPISVEGNSGLVESLNVDLLDGQHGIYYTDASNMTGLFDYDKVTFNNLEGTVGYIPVFDSRTIGPSRTISDSYIKQTQSNVIITQDANLFVGSTNSGNVATDTALIGKNNKGYSDSSLAVGTNNIVSGTNSIALNLGSKAIKNNSIAAGSYGYTWSNNQLSFGSFIEKDSNTTLAQGQYSTIALGLAGAETNGSWVSLSPDVVIPKNKTLAYSLEILMNKAAGTRAALIVFDSGIIKNSTYRDPSDVTRTLNSTMILKNGDKQEVYNDSQKRRHFYHYQLENNSIIQNLDVTDKPLNLLPLSSQNTSTLYKYTPDYTYLDGFYTKTNDGSLRIKTNKPISSGWFIQNSGARKTNIRSYNHGMTTGCIADLNFISGSLHKPFLTKYKVTNIVDNNNFLIEENEWKGILTNNEIILDPYSVIDMNSSGAINISGSIYTNGSVLINASFNPSGVYQTGMIVEYGPDRSIYPGLTQTGIITGCDNRSISFYPAFTGVDANGYSINSPAYCINTNYTKYIFDSAKIVQVNLGNYGYQSLSSISGSYIKNYCGLPTLAIRISGLNTSFTGLPITIKPASLNSGILTLTPKRNTSGSFSRSDTVFNRYEGIYTREESTNGTSIISVYNKYLEPIELPSAPFTYSLVCGEGDSNNSYFRIQNENLITTRSFASDSASAYSIRVRSYDRSGRMLEKPISIVTGVPENNNDTLSNGDNNSLNLNNIIVTNNKISRNTPSGLLVGKLLTMGGYSPYIEFTTAYNGFSGVFVSGSNKISECFLSPKTYPTTILYGNPDLIHMGMRLYSSISGLSNGGIVQDIIGPTSINGYISSGSNIISGCSTNPTLGLFSGIRLESALSGWKNDTRVISVTNNSITLNTIFSGEYRDSTPITVNSIGKSFQISSTFSGITSSGKAIYSGYAPNPGNYYPTNLQTYPTEIISGICPQTYTTYQNKGFYCQENTNNINYYVTGTAYFYTNEGYSTIDVSPAENLYIDDSEDSCYIEFTSVNTGSLPVSSPYQMISGLSQSSFSIYNTYLYPDKSVFSTGNLKINLDRNHGFQILNNDMLNQVPVKFMNTILNNSDRIPVNNLFDIKDIVGSTLILSDNQNYLLKQNNKPDYFEQPIDGFYRTNGFAFNSVLISGQQYAYECSEGVVNLEPNQVIGSTSNILGFDTRVVFSHDYINVNGIANSGSSIIQLQTLNSANQMLPNAILYSSSDMWPSTGVAISNITPSSIIISDFAPVTEPTNISFYTKPYVKLNKTVCLNNSRKISTQLYFNGSYIYISGYSTPRSYLNNNDQIKILKLNDSNAFASGTSQYVQVLTQNNRKTAMTGMAVGGIKNIPPINNINGDTLKRNEYRYSDPFGLNRYSILPNTGTISFIGAVSGHCTIPFNNNIFYHTYGGSTASWPMDPSGNLVPHPQTGIYTIYSNAQNCTSGTMCIRIDGFNNTNFNNFNDIINRNSVGKNHNFITTNDTSGYVRPWGLNKKLYFDFTDDAPELNGSYYIADKMTPSTLSLNIPYDASLINRSGLVYIIDNDFNIKSNRNPNIDNDLVLSSAQISITPSNSLVDYTINSYNAGSKRWKHAIHIKDAPVFSGYKASFNGSSDISEMIFIQPETIKISKVEFSFDLASGYTEISSEDTVNVPSNKNIMYLRVSTIDGAAKWDSSLTRCAPRININGLASYEVNTQDLSFDNITKTWSIPLVVSNLSSLTLNNKNIVITASDESSTASVSINLENYIYPIINPTISIYEYKNSPDGWFIPFDIKYLTDNVNAYTISVTGYPSSSYNISDEIFTNSYGISTKIVSGPVGSVTGVFHPTMTIRDTSSNILAVQSGQLTVLEINQSKPAYTIQPQGLDDDIYLNISSSSTSSFAFYIPATNPAAAETNLSVTFQSDDGYTIEPIIEYNALSQRYRITAFVTGSDGYYASKNISIAISQPRYDSDDNLIWTRYYYNKLINLTLYRNIEINKTAITEPLAFDIQEPWFINFRINHGICAYRPDLAPQVRLSDLPTIGTYETQPLEYNISRSYDSQAHNWVVTITPKRNIFGKYTEVIGSHQIKIYAEDRFSSVSGTLDLLFTRAAYLDNIINTLYATPNNPYQSLIDIKQPSTNLLNSPSVSFPGSLKENTINLYRAYYKYDKYFDLWEYAYSGTPILDKWDATIDITNTNGNLSSNQYSSLIVKCKGIATDKIYAIGKLNLIELDSNSLESAPLQIVNLASRYQLSEGSAWKINFSTIGGLENPNYPPTILLSGMPSACSGYNPKIPLQQQNTCFTSRGWNAASKRWDFSFDGLPLCNIEGLKPFVVTAIDTDTSQNLYLGYDVKNSEILYTSLLDNGVDHPKPQIIVAPGDLGNGFTTALTPFCGAPPVNRNFKFGTKNREICPFPTGITGWVVSGSLPPGLSYSITFPGPGGYPASTSPVSPWSNLSSGTLRFNGEPLTFASGGTYPEKFYLTVYDARNKFKTQEFSFIDSSTANPPSPIDITVYFDDIKPIYTRRADPQPTDPINFINLSGTLPIDKGSYGNISVEWPPAIPSSLICTSILPHNQCQTSVFAYSGADHGAGDFRVFISGIKFGLSNNDLIYAEFNNNSNNAFNGVYRVSGYNPLPFITLVGNTFTVGSGRLVKSTTSSISSQDLQKFNGTLDINTSEGILGCGSFKYKQNIPGDTAGYGLFGRLRPGYEAVIPYDTGIFSSSDIHFSGLQLSAIPNNEQKIFTVKTSNCWETGYIRISGIKVPRPIVELTDPAPSPFTYNNQDVSLVARMAYGDTISQRNNIINQRSSSINYVIKDIINNTIYSQGSTSRLIDFKNFNINSGTVMSLFINNNPSTFPTYKYDAMPYNEQEYFWIHKAGFPSTTPTQGSFPPVIMTGIKDHISCISGSSISGYSIRAIGGYIPSSGVTPIVPFYKLNISDANPWNLYDYNPSFTGILQKNLNKNPISGSFIHPGSQGPQLVTINLPQGYFAPGDYIRLAFPSAIIPNTGLILPGNYNGNISFSLSSSQPLLGSVTGYGASLVSEVSSTGILLRHNNISYNIGDAVDLINDSANSTETSLFPNKANLYITSGDSRYLYCLSSSLNNYDLSSHFQPNDLCEIRKNYYDQIKLSNISFAKLGEWNMTLSGTPTGLYKDYIYKMISYENSDIPAFSNTSLSPKKYNVEYPLYINKPISIVLPESVLNDGLTKTNGSWSLTFDIEGGKRPIYQYTPEITVNGSICNFTRALSPSGMNDSYNQITDRLSVTLTSTNKINYNWSSQSSIELKVFDETGYDIKTIQLHS